MSADKKYLEQIAVLPADSIKEVSPTNRTLEVPQNAWLRAPQQKSILQAAQTAQDYLDVGYVFANFIGGGEKPILAATIEIDGQVVNLATKAFLTEAELNAVCATIADRYESLFGQKIDFQELARAVIDYWSKYIALNKRLQVIKESNAFEEAEYALREYTLDHGMPTPTTYSTWDAVDYLFANAGLAYRGTAVGTIDPRQRENVNIRKSYSHGENPFLADEYVLTGLDDRLLILDSRRDEPIRMNNYIALLLSHGIENLDNENTAADQKYLDAATFITEIRSQPDNFDEVSKKLDKLENLDAEQILAESAKMLRSNADQFNKNILLERPLSQRIADIQSKKSRQNKLARQIQNLFNIGRSNALRHSLEDIKEVFEEVRQELASPEGFSAMPYIAIAHKLMNYKKELGVNAQSSEYYQRVAVDLDGLFQEVAKQATAHILKNLNVDEAEYMLLTLSFKAIGNPENEQLRELIEK